VFPFQKVVNSELEVPISQFFITEEDSAEITSPDFEASET